MRLYGEEVPEHIIDHALSGMELHRGFTMLNLVGALRRAGASKDDRVLNRCADRTLQKLRKMGAIAFDGRVWKATPEAS
jgi:hypothetical protein